MWSKKISLTSTFPLWFFIYSFDNENAVQLIIKLLYLKVNFHINRSIPYCIYKILQKDPSIDTEVPNDFFLDIMHPI